MNFRRSLVAGAVAGAMGTAAMDYALYRRYRAGGGTQSFPEWEFAEDVTSWDEASAPGQLGEKVERVVTRQAPPGGWARATTNAVHWATGIGWGLQFGAVAGRSRHRWVVAAALGPVAWLAGYVVLPLAGVYKPIWDYDAHTLGEDLSAHLVYGAATSAAFAAMTLGSRTS
jgi:hypothetical protein